MDKRNVSIVLCLALLLTVLPLGVGQVCAQPDAAVEKIDSAARTDSLRERANRVQERRNQRAAYEKWKNSKARNKAALTKAAPLKDGKGAAK